MSRGGNEDKKILFSALEDDFIRGDILNYLSRNLTAVFMKIIWNLLLYNYNPVTVFNTEDIYVFFIYKSFSLVNMFSWVLGLQRSYQNSCKLAFKQEVSINSFV